MKRPNPTIALLLWLTAAYAAGFVGSAGVRHGLETVYPGLAKPAWNPPDWLFAPVWTVLYALIGTAAWRIWRTQDPRLAPLGLWWLGLLLNALWPWAFFGFGKFGLAFGVVALLWTTILATIVAFSKRDKTAAWLLVPYLAWVGFATILNLAIWRLNGP